MTAPRPDGRTAAVNLAAAEAVLRANDRGGYTVPSPLLYPFQWLWDAGFAALGWVRIDPARAGDELDSVLAGQWASGGLAHIVFHRPDAGYFPGPERWNRSSASGLQTTGITQPPVLACVVRRLLAVAPQLAERAEGWAVHLDAAHRWVDQHRGIGPGGAVACVHPWETGADNAAAWDGPMGRVPVAGVEPYRRRDTEHVPADQRPTATDYDRYMALVEHGRDLGWDDAAIAAGSPFAVVDPAFAAIAVRAERDLAAVWRRLGRPDAAAAADERADRQLAALDACCWDPVERWWRAYDVRAGERTGPCTHAGAVVLWAGPPAGRVAPVLERIGRWCDTLSYGLPTTDPDDPTFEPRRYWRGPVWVNVNWLVAEGLAELGADGPAARLRADIGRLVAAGGWAEYFDPGTGEGYGSTQFTWTAALVLDLAHRGLLP